MARISLTIEDRLLNHIDQAARAAGLSRSAYINCLLSNELVSGVGPGADPSVHEALRRLDELFEHVTIPEDPTAAIRAERDAH